MGDNAKIMDVTGKPLRADETGFESARNTTRIDDEFMGYTQPTMADSHLLLQCGIPPLGNVEHIMQSRPTLLGNNFTALAANGQVLRKDEGYMASR